MRPKITFFYKQDETTGATEWMGVKTANRTVALHIYSRVLLRPKAAHLLQKNQLPTDAAYPEFMKDLEKAVVEYGEGGLIAESTTDGKTCTLKISTIPSNDPQSPEEGLLLRPGYPARFVELGNGVKLSQGQHLIVPVDKEAQGKLKELVGLLKWFPPDTEDLILNMIWRPGLERRLHEVEERVGVKSTYAAASAGGKDGASFFSRINRFGGLSSVVSLVLILTLALFSLGTRKALSSIREEIAALGSSPSPSPPSPSPPSPSPPPPAPPPPSPPPPSPPPPTLLDISDEVRPRLDAAFAALNQALSDLPESNAKRVLYDSHFKDNPVGQVTELENNENFAWGMVKLFALDKNVRVQGLDASKAVAYVTRRSDAKRWLHKMILSRDEKHLLGLVTCMAFEENREKDQAGLPLVSTDTVKEREDLPLKCSGVNAEYALKSLRQLGS